MWGQAATLQRRTEKRHQLPQHMPVLRPLHYNIAPKKRPVALDYAIALASACIRYKQHAESTPITKHAGYVGITHLSGQHICH